MTRRIFISTGVLASLAVTAWPKLVSPFAQSWNDKEDGLLCGADAKRIFVTERNPESHGSRALSMNPLNIPPVISGGTLTLSSGSQQIVAGTSTNMLLINNSFPAPTIKLNKGDTFNATVQNNLTVPSVLHWHGIHAPANMSGHPKDAVGVGNSYSVSFPIIQRASTNFYHAHPDMTTAEQVYMGLVGMFIISDEDEAALGLPTGNFDIPLVLTDKRFDAHNQLVYNPADEDYKSGWIGDTILVNGTSNAFLNVSPTLYRFRLVNASNARFFKIALSMATFMVIGNDGGLLPQPVTVTSVMLSPAERLDMLIDFSGFPNEIVTLESLAFTNNDPPSSCTLTQGAPFDILQFQVSATGSSGGTVPTALPAITPYLTANVLRTRIFSFGVEDDINSQEFSLTRIDQNVPFGELEEWSFVSEGANTHPIHVHGVQFQVVSRNGNPPDPWEMGWKDVIRLDPLATVNVLLQFAEYTGIFLIHCHKLEHADMGMMSNFEVDPTNAVEEQSAGTQTMEIYPNPASSSATLSFPMLNKQETLLIVDEKGAVVLEKILTPGTSTMTLELSGFASGTYQTIVGTARGRFDVER